MKFKWNENAVHTGVSAAVAAASAAASYETAAIY